ncbi:uncharacterized protein LOC121864440 [Homarus americanus]|uniref:uncharacterized protein LOC121864440 n=1 Tax=Homarus americanus TaxID=6706 RepID=UPI001C44A0F5|nr:uncharacterized protein LOC121864440 [Homarus americanus]
MKYLVLVLLGLAALVAARPDNVFDLDDLHHDQDIDDDNTYTGTYRFMTPEGVEYFVRYVADDDGFRVLESNAVPASDAGVKADGNQGSFTSSEELDDRK